MDDSPLAALSGDKGWIPGIISKVNFQSDSSKLNLSSINLPMHKIFVFFVILDVLVINEEWKLG